MSNKYKIDPVLYDLAHQECIRAIRARSPSSSITDGLVSYDARQFLDQTLSMLVQAHESYLAMCNANAPSSARIEPSEGADSAEVRKFLSDFEDKKNLLLSEFREGARRMMDSLHRDGLVKMLVLSLGPERKTAIRIVDECILIHT